MDSPVGRRILQHPILGSLPEVPVCHIAVDGKWIPAREGEPILAALLAAGVIVVRTTGRYGAPRGLFCGIGHCSDCLVTVDGQRNVPACGTLVRNGMRVETLRSA